MSDFELELLETEEERIAALGVVLDVGDLGSLGSGAHHVTVLEDEDVLEPVLADADVGMAARRPSVAAHQWQPEAQSPELLKKIHGGEHGR